MYYYGYFECLSTRLNPLAEGTSTPGHHAESKLLLQLCMLMTAPATFEGAYEETPAGMHDALAFRSTSVDQSVDQGQSVDSQTSVDNQIVNETGLDMIRTAIDMKIAEDAVAARGAEALRAHQTFVIKPGVDGLLDVARQTYSTVIDDIYEYTETVKEEFDLPELKLVFKTRGYEFVHPIAGVEQLPDIATQKTRQKSRWIFLTKELSALNDRMKPGRNR